MRTRAEYLELLRCYKQQMAERYGIIRLGIFGSVSRNEQNIDSDLCRDEGAGWLYSSKY